MISKNLLADLEPRLKEAEEVWVIVALLKDNTFNKIQNLLPKDIHQHYIVGIDLPTSPSILEILKNKNSRTFSARVYSTAITFHPKVYLIKGQHNYTAFIGSANATQGGFEKNIELSYKITNQDDCLKILDWFNDLFKNTSEITDTFIEKYKVVYKRNRYYSSIQKSNTDKLKGLSEVVPGGVLNVNHSQFFRQADFDAFAPNNHKDASEAAKSRRKQVRERFLELNRMIYPRFAEYNITELYLPARATNYTSQYFHTPRSSEIKDALWLNYGKSVEELSLLNDTNFTRNIRIQVIIRNTTEEAYVGIWLFIAKLNGSFAERNYLHQQLDNPSFLNLLFEYIMDLGGGYWINLNDDERWVSQIETTDDLRDFLIEDDFESYFIIGRNYQPNDVDISTENIAETVLTEFSKLFRIYQLIKAK